MAVYKEISIDVFSREKGQTFASKMAFRKVDEDHVSFATLSGTKHMLVSDIVEALQVLGFDVELSNVKEM